MHYEKFTITEFFTQINTKEKAIELAWNHKLGGEEFQCQKCSHDDYYTLKSRPEVRQCAHCRHHNRLRPGTIFENSKVSILKWVQVIYLSMSGKRGVSALEVQKQLKIGSYRTALSMLHRIRDALGNRDEMYKLKDLIEVDSTCFGKAHTGNQREVLVAIESKEWEDEKGEERKNAGFAKVLVTAENKDSVDSFIRNNVEQRTEVHSDGAKAYKYADDDLNVHSMNTYNDHKLNEQWLPWVHRFISNAKTWILGTHHGVSGHYLEKYLKEYTYRFNRRHDPKGLFSRGLRACCLSTPNVQAASSA